MRRRPDRDPPRPRRPAGPLVATWLLAAIGLGVLLALARSAQGPLDDRDQAWQRPGFLDAGDLPDPGPMVVPGLPERGRPTVVLFQRADGVGRLCRALSNTSLADKAATAVVVSATAPGHCARAGAVVGDPDGALAVGYGMRRPIGGGPPVGYAVVDSSGSIRYRTLDPGVSDHLGEVATIVAALP